MTEGRVIGKIINGVLDLTDKELNESDLKRLPVLPTLRVLILTGNDIGTFEFLKPQPNLESIVACNCQIHCLSGLPEQPKLTSVDLTGTPLEEKEDFRVLAIATIGTHIEVLNNEPVTKEELKAAEVAAREQKERLFDAQHDIEKNIMGGEKPPAPGYEEMARLYVKEHYKLFSPFAYNRALIYDLHKFGELPIVDETSTGLDIIRATNEIKKRNEKLREIIRAKGAELGLDPNVQ